MTSLLFSHLPICISFLISVLFIGLTRHVMLPSSLFCHSSYVVADALWQWLSAVHSQPGVAGFAHAAATKGYQFQPLRAKKRTGYRPSFIAHVSISFLFPVLTRISQCAFITIMF